MILTIFGKKCLRFSGGSKRKKCQKDKKLKIRGFQKKTCVKGNKKAYY